MMFRWILATAGGLVVVKVAADAWVQVYRDRPFSTLLGSVLVLAVVAALGLVLLGESRGDTRRASHEYAPAPPTRDAVEHVVHVVHHHEIIHTHRYEGTAQQQPPRSRLGPVVDGEVVRREIEDGNERG